MNKFTSKKYGLTKPPKELVDVGDQVIKISLSSLYIKTYVKAIGDRVVANFSDLNIYSIEKDVFVGSNITHLYLNDNHLEHVTHSMFKGLEDTLEYLNLSHNNLQCLEFEAASFPKLKVLDLSNNPNCAPDLMGGNRVFSSFPSLEEINLSRNDMFKLCPSSTRQKVSSFSNNPKLKIIDLSYNDFGNGEVPTAQHFFYLKELKEVDLTGCSIDENDEVWNLWFCKNHEAKLSALPADPNLNYEMILMKEF